MTVTVVDAFADRPFIGNPAANIRTIQSFPDFPSPIAKPWNRSR